MVHDCKQPLLYNIYSVWQVSASHVSACTVRLQLWLSTRSEGMIWKECKTCLNSLQSTPAFDWLAQPTNTTEPTKQCVVLTGTPIFVASRTVNAAPSSIVNPLEVKQVKYVLHEFNISTSWGRKLTICLYLVMGFNEHMHHGASLRTCNMLLRYAYATCCFVTHMHYTASLYTCTMPLHYAHAPRCFVTPMHQKKKPSDFSDTRSLHKHITYNTEGHRM